MANRKHFLNRAKTEFIIKKSSDQQKVVLNEGAKVEGIVRKEWRSGRR